MNKLNLYYIISIIILAVMMMIMMRTLEVTGWFEKHGEQSPVARLRQSILGQFYLEESGFTTKEAAQILRISKIDAVDPEWLVITLDTLSLLQVKVGDFEDEQVLVEIFQPDSSGKVQRLEGCELLVATDSTGELTGSTIGEFCEVNQDFHAYVTLYLEANNSRSFVKIETHEYDSQALLSSKKYIIKRRNHDE